MVLTDTHLWVWMGSMIFFFRIVWCLKKVKQQSGWKCWEFLSWTKTVSSIQQVFGIHVTQIALGGHQNEEYLVSIFRADAMWGTPLIWARFWTREISLQRYVRGVHKFLGTSKHLHGQICTCFAGALLCYVRAIWRDKNFFLTFVLLQVRKRICEVLAHYTISS